MVRQLGVGERLSWTSVREFPSHQFLIIRQRVYSSQLSVRDLETLIIFNAVQLFAVILYFRFAVHRSSGFIFAARLLLLLPIVYRPSSVISRLPSSARLPSPLVRHPIVLPLYRHRLRGSHANPIEQVPHQSCTCRKLCIVLSSAGLKKTTHPLLHWVRNIIKFPFDHFHN